MAGVEPTWRVNIGPYLLRKCRRAGAREEKEGMNQKRLPKWEIEGGPGGNACLDLFCAVKCNRNIKRTTIKRISRKSIIAMVTDLKNMLLRFSYCMCTDSSSYIVIVACKEAIIVRIWTKYVVVKRPSYLIETFI